MATKTRMIVIGDFYRHTRDFLLNLFNIMAEQSEVGDKKIFSGWRKTPPNLFSSDMEKIGRILLADIKKLKEVYSLAGLTDQAEKDNDPPSVDLLDLYIRMVIRADLAVGAMYMAWLRQICAGDFVDSLPKPNAIPNIDVSISEINLNTFYSIARYNDKLTGNNALSEQFADIVLTYFHSVAKHKQTILSKNLRNIAVGDSVAQSMTQIGASINSIFPALEKFMSKFQNSDISQENPKEFIKESFGDFVRAVPILSNNEEVTNQTVSAILNDERVNNLVTRMFPAQQKNEEENSQIEASK